MAFGLEEAFQTALRHRVIVVRRNDFMRIEVAGFFASVGGSTAGERVVRMPPDDLNRRPTPLAISVDRLDDFG